jgi:hypothetical protein
MRMPKNRVAVLLLCSWFVLACADITTESIPKIPMNWQRIDSLSARLPEGIEVFAGKNDEVPLRAWYARISLSDGDLLPRVVVSADSSDNRENISEFARRLHAPLVVNAGYFTMYKSPAGHMGLLMVDHRVIEPANRSVTRGELRFPVIRAAIGFDDNAKPHFGWVRSKGDSLLRWEKALPNQPDKPANEPEYGNATFWPMRDAVGAGPMLIYNGKIRITSEEEVFFGTSIPLVHPRTAIGYDQNDNLLILVVDGRQEQSCGVNLSELASLMADLGAVYAINLDGGGSTAMVADGVLLNRPAGKTLQREVMSAIAIFEK